MVKKIYLFLLFLVGFIPSYSYADYNRSQTDTVTTSKVVENIDYLNENNNKPSAATVQPSLQPSDLPTLPSLTIPSAPPTQPKIPIPAVIGQSSAIATKQAEEKEIALQKEKDKLDEEKNEQLVDKLMGLNYSTKTPPKKLYEKNLSEDNKHIPPVYFKSYYLYLAFKAIENNNIDALRAVLSRYDFVNGQNKDGNTLLIQAVESNSVNSARVLLAKGAYVNGVNSRGRTALHYAATLGDYELVRLLLTMGADKLIVDDKNMTALDYAIDNNNAEIISILSKYKTK